MDTRSELRYLVTNNIMPDYDYVNTRYSFQTVFYATDNPYSYCLCPCTFEHELVMYISDTKDVDEEMFARVVDNIIAGKCPHVNKVSKEYVKDTIISGLHIAGAVNSFHVFEKDISDLKYVTSARLSMNPLHIAVMKRSNQFLSAYLDRYRYGTLSSYVKAEMLTGTINKMRIRWLEGLQVYAKDGTLEQVNCLLNTSLRHTPNNVAKAVGAAMKRNTKKITECLISYARKCELSSKHPLWSHLCIIRAIVYDRPDIVAKLLEDNNKMNTWDIENLRRIASLFDRPECQDAISSYDQSTSYSIKLPTNMFIHCNLLVAQNLFLNFYDDFRSDVNSIIKRVLIQNESGSKEITCIRHRSILASILKSLDMRLNTLPMGTYRNMVNDLINLGGDIDYTDSEGNSAVMIILKRTPMHHLVFREVLETLIFENPDTQLNPLTVVLALESDLRSNQSETDDLLPGTYVTDGKLHALFDASCSLNWAFNFTTPLLIECGFPFNRTYIRQHPGLGHLPGRSLHPAVKEYLEQWLGNPPQLTKICRDVLRKYFVGKKIHKFVETIILPEAIRNFILLKPVLRCI